MGKILVFGGRNYTDSRRLFEELDQVALDIGVHCVVHGAAFGTDLLSEDWAKLNQIAYRGYPAPWRKHIEGWCKCAKKSLKVCKSSGFYRNDLMLRAEHGGTRNENQKIKLAVAFPGANGTADMHRLCEEAGIEIKVIR